MTEPPDRFVPDAQLKGGQSALQPKAESFDDLLAQFSAQGSLEPPATRQEGQNTPQSPEASAIAAASAPTPEHEPLPLEHLREQLPTETKAEAASKAHDKPAPATQAAPRLLVSAKTDIGCVRTNNEDAFGCCESDGLFVVCDGMGGMASGEIASSRTVATILSDFSASKSSGASVSSRLLQAINAANRDVWQFSQNPDHKGMGTTAVAAALDGNRLIISNVGDSRAYHCTNGRCTQVTIDHSYINELIRQGTISLENAQDYNLRGMESVISRAVGAKAEVEPDFFAVELEPGSITLLASDGLCRYVTPEEIAAILSASELETACGNLIEVAKQRGGKDNITCLLLLAVHN